MVESLLMAMRHWPIDGQILVMQGGAEGFDQQVEDLCGHLGFATETWKPEYGRYKPEDRWVAPLERNTQMVNEGPDLVIAGMIGNPEKGGTLDTLNKAKARGIPCLILNLPANFPGVEPEKPPKRKGIVNARSDED